MEKIEITRWRDYSDTVAVQKVDSTGSKTQTNLCNTVTKQMCVHHRKITEKDTLDKIDISAFVVEYLINLDNAINERLEP